MSVCLNVCLCLMIFNVWMARVGEWAYLPLIQLSRHHTTRQQWNLSNENLVMVILGCCTSHFYMDRIKVMNHAHWQGRQGRHTDLHNSQNFHWILDLRQNLIICSWLCVFVRIFYPLLSCSPFLSRSLTQPINWHFLYVQRAHIRLYVQNNVICINIAF